MIDKAARWSTKRALVDVVRELARVLAEGWTATGSYAKKGAADRALPRGILPGGSVPVW